MENFSYISLGLFFCFFTSHMWSNCSINLFYCYALYCTALGKHQGGQSRILIKGNTGKKSKYSQTGGYKKIRNLKDSLFFRPWSGSVTTTVRRRRWQENKRQPQWHYCRKDCTPERVQLPPRWDRLWQKGSDLETDLTPGSEMRVRGCGGDPCWAGGAVDI